MTDGETIFVDTNILLDACDESRDGHELSLQFLENGLSGKLHLFTSGQVFREFLVVATRPIEVNGLGLPPSDAIANIQEFARTIRLLEENESVSQKLRELVQKLHLQGKHIHDANIAATMLEHGIGKIATWNADDFVAFPGVIPVPPRFD